MKDYKAKVIHFQPSRNLPDNSNETDFKIPIKPAMAEKLQAIGQAEGVDPICLGVLAIAHLINSKWDRAKNEPRKKEGNPHETTTKGSTRLI
jgi:hypothetical protein